MKRGNMTENQYLDYIMTAHRIRMYPIIYCHIQLAGRLDKARLTRAVTACSRYVPEILWTYQFRRGRFVDKGLTPGDVVLSSNRIFAAGWQWDLSVDTQLKLSVCPGERGDTLIAAVSHILTDGMGFLQLLYLLAALYNGETPEEGTQNQRDIAPILKGIQVGPRTVGERLVKRIAPLPLAFAAGGGERHCLFITIDSGTLDRLREKARRRGATINDVLLTAYARVLAGRQGREQIPLPCPADLRRFAPDTGQLTVANMTGMYTLGAAVPAGRSFDYTLAGVGAEMARLKAECRCFARLRMLRRACALFSPPVGNWLIRRCYRIPPVSYTNLGVIDEKRLVFLGCTVRSCFVTGSYRRTPDFQLSASTFRGECTLSANLIGGMDRGAEGLRMLEQIKGELLAWAGD